MAMTKTTKTVKVDADIGGKKPFYTVHENV
jgi:hypothetical protein